MANQIEAIKVSRAEWNGVRYRHAHLMEVEAERVGEHFAIHKVVEPYSDYKYAVTHVKTGWALCRTLTKPDARKAVKMALGWPGLNWAKLTHKNQQTPASMERGRALLVALSEAGVAADIHVVNGRPVRDL